MKVTPVVGLTEMFNLYIAARVKGDLALSNSHYNRKPHVADTYQPSTDKPAEHELSSHVCPTCEKLMVILSKYILFEVTDFIYINKMQLKNIQKALFQYTVKSVLKITCK